MPTDLESFVSSPEPPAPSVQPPGGSSPTGGSSLNPGIVDLFHNDPDPKQLDYAVSEGRNTPPDMAAKALSIQQKTGMPTDLINRNMPAAEKTAAGIDFDSKQYQQDHPVVSGWVKEDPNHAALAQNDMENLGYTERLFGSIKNGYRSSVLTNELNGIGRSAILGTRTQAQQERQAQIEKELADMPNYGLKGVSQVPGLLVNFATSKPAIMGAAGAVVGLPFGAPQIGATAGFAAQGAGDSAAQMYLNLEKRGVDRKTALGLAAITGTLNGALMTAPIGKLTGLAPGLEWLQNLGVNKVLESPTIRNAIAKYGVNVVEQMGVQGVMNSGQSFINSISEDIGELHKSGALAKMSPAALLSTFFRDENIQKAKAEFEPGAMTGLGLAGITGGFGFRSDILRAQDAQVRAQAFSEVGKTIANSETFQKAPQKTQEIVSRLTKDGPLENAYIPMESFQTYWQGKKVDPRAAAEAILGDAKPYDEAMRTGADLQIPMSKYAVTIAPTEHNAFFQDELRTNPNEMNARESKEYLKSEMEAVKEGAAPSPQEESAARVRENISQQLRTSGYSQATAENYGKLYESVFKSMGERSGLDPEELYKKYGLNIQKLEGELPPREKSLSPNVELMQSPGELPIMQPGAATGEPHGLFSYNSDLNPEREMRSMYTLYGDPEHPLMKEMAEGSKNFKTTQTMDWFKERDIPITGREPRSVQWEPLDQGVSDVQGASLRVRPEPSPTEQAPSAPKGISPLSEEAQRSVFPGPADSSLQRITAEPEYVKMRAKAADVVDRFAKERNIAPTPELAKQLFTELHDALGDVRKAKPEERLQVARDVMRKYPNLESDFMTLKDQLWSDQTDPYFDKFVKGRKEYMQSAYHGSPHDFDEFKLNKIGTGEGAQSYGWGLYFAGSKEVAKHYRDSLSEDRLLVGRGKEVLDAPKNETEKFVKSIIGRAFDLMGDDKEQAYSYARDMIDRFPTEYKDAMKARGINPKEASALVDELIESGVTRKKKGTIYKADIPDDSEYLNYDKKISEQPKIQEAFPPNKARQIIKEWEKGAGEPFTEVSSSKPQNFYDMTGKELYATLADLENYKGVKDYGEQSKNASLRLSQEFGIPGIKYLDQESRGEGKGTSNYVVFDDKLVKIMNKYQQGGERGMLSFGGDRQMNISLLKNADLSTFLHETGHFYTEVMKDLSSDPKASEQIKNDFQALREFAGVKEGKDFEVEHHEKIAKAFESYLMEGKAPSEALRTPFARFRSWLVSVYRQVKNIGVELTPQVRGVFDRMLASDDEINAAQVQQDMAPMFADPKAVGMTQDKADAYQKAVAAARMSAERDLMGQQSREMQKHLSDQWKTESDHLREEVSKQVDTQPDQMARAFLKDGTFPNGDPLPEKMQGFKLSKLDLKKDFPDYDLKNLRGYYAAEGGVHPDEAAGKFGFKSGSEMLFALENSEPREAVLDRLVDQQMKEKYGDLMKPENLAEAAMKAVHNTDRAKVLQMELQHLASEDLPALKGMIRQMTRRIPALDEVTTQANEMVMNSLNRDIYPSLYQRAEAREARLAGEALTRGDIHGAFEAKQRELLNHEAYRAASDWKDQIDKSLDYFGKFDKESVRGRLAKGGRDGGTYLEQIDALLDQYDIRKSVSLKELGQRKDLASWLGEQRMDKGYDVDIPEKFLKDTERMHWKDMKAQDFSDLYDTVRNIEHLGRDQAKIFIEGQMHDYANVLNELRSSLRSFHTVGEGEPPTLTKNMADRYIKGMKEKAAEHIRPEFQFKQLDGDKDYGPFWKYFFKPTADAENNELIWRQQSIDAIKKVFNDNYSKTEQRSLWDRIETPEVNNKTISKMNLLMMAANHGNRYNLEGMIEGAKSWMREDQLQTLMEKHLTLADWKVVQGMADHINSWWPQISEMEKRLNGIVPPKVEGDPISMKTADGKVFKSDGWYWPIKFDPEQDIAAKRMESKENVEDLFGGSYARAQTQQGHLQARTNTAGRPFLLDMSVLSDHLSNMIHDLSHREAVININKLLSDPDVRRDISMVQGKESFDQLMPWLRSVAGEKMGNPIAKTEGLIGTARANITVASLGLRLPVALKHLISYGAAVRELGPEYSARGMADAWGKPWEIKDRYNFIAERSPMMASRQMFLDRDLRDYWKGLQGITPHDANIQKSFTMFLNGFDLATSIPTWLGAYKKAMEGQVEGAATGDEKSAIAYSDSVVRMTKGSASPKDLPTVMKGSPAYKIWTMFYNPMNLALNNMNKARGEYMQDRSVTKAIAGAALTWFVPALLHDRISRGVSDDDKEHPIRNAAVDIAGFPIEGTVFGRNIIQAAKAVRGASDDPFSDFLNTSGKVLSAVGKRAFGEKDEFNKSDINAMIDTAGSLTGIPTRQIWGTTESLYDWMTGNDSPDNTMQGLWNVARGKAVST